jgi:hypothetical protein
MQDRVKDGIVQGKWRVGGEGWRVDKLTGSKVDKGESLVETNLHRVYAV